MMTRRKLVFFVDADPGYAPGAVWSAYHFATIAAQAGLEAEVRLAGDAVKVALPDAIAETSQGRQLREKVQAGTGPGYRVSM